MSFGNQEDGYAVTRLQQSDLFDVVGNRLSTQRLALFMEVAEGDMRRAVTLYEWNVRLAESFYTPLHFVEICYRNLLSLQLARDYGDCWSENPQCPLQEDSREDLRRYAKSDIFDVANLNFGFWVALLGPRYDHSLWRRSLYKAFRRERVRKRSLIHGRLNSIRRFRNRVMHHEPILAPGLAVRHAEIIEAIDWLCPHTGAWVEKLSRYNQVAADAARYIPSLRGRA